MGRFDKFGGGNLPTVQSSGGQLTASKKEELLKSYAQKGQSVGRSDIVRKALEQIGEFAICLDATGSMAALLEDAKASIGAIVDRVAQHANARIKLKLFVYRDYDCDDKVLEESPLTSDPAVLVRWLFGIQAMGGGGNSGEAIEKPLEAIYRAGNFDCVLIAGDEPPNCADQIPGGIVSKRQTAFDWAKHLAQKKVPIHSFVVGNWPGTAAAFKEISALSGGQSGQLDGSAEMIDMAAMAMIASLKGAKAVDAYAKAHPLSRNAKQFGHLLIAGPSRASK